jgi:hypothetical protein
LNHFCVFTGKLHVHQSHVLGHSYLPTDDKTIERKSNKGRRLIILHEITTDGPLCVTEENGRPIDDLLWKGNMHAIHQHLERMEKYPVKHCGSPNPILVTTMKHEQRDVHAAWVEEKLVPRCSNLNILLVK